MNTTSGDDLDGTASNWALGLTALLNDGRDEDCRGYVTSVATSLAALGADNVDAEVEALLDVLNVTDHVHVEDAVLVELINDGLGRNADGGNEELAAGLDDDVNELVKLALGVIVAVISVSVLFGRLSHANPR